MHTYFSEQCCIRLKIFGCIVKNRESLAVVGYSFFSLRNWFVYHLICPPYYVINIKLHSTSKRWARVKFACEGWDWDFQYWDLVLFFVISTCETETDTSDYWSQSLNWNSAFNGLVSRLRIIHAELYFIYISDESKYL